MCLLSLYAAVAQMVYYIRRVRMCIGVFSAICAHGIRKKDKNMLGWVLKAVTWSLSLCAAVGQMGYARKTRTCWAGC